MLPSGAGLFNKLKAMMWSLSTSTASYRDMPLFFSSENRLSSFLKVNHSENTNSDFISKL